MSAINKKVFNPNQKINKAKFLGAPALITTEDLNRQIDINDYRDTMLEKNSLLTSTVDIGVSVGGQGDTFTMPRPSGSFDYTQVRDVTITLSNGVVTTKGCGFVIGATSRTISCALDYYVSIGLYADKELLTSANDPSKEISGAKFASGLTHEAAAHYIYKNEEVIFRKGEVLPVVAGKELIAVLGKVRFERHNTPLLEGDGQTRVSFKAVLDKFYAQPSAYPDYLEAFRNTKLNYYGSTGEIVMHGGGLSDRLVSPGDTIEVAFQKVCGFLSELFETTEREITVNDIDGNGNFQVTIFQRGGWVWMVVRVNPMPSTQDTLRTMTSEEIFMPIPMTSPLVISTVTRGTITSTTTEEPEPETRVGEEGSTRPGTSGRTVVTRGTMPTSTVELVSLSSKSLLIRVYTEATSEAGLMARTINASYPYKM